ncbi:MAG: hypothetical protein QXH10_09905 [Ignisphaera sp.]
MTYITYMLDSLYNFEEKVVYTDTGSVKVPVYGGEKHSLYWAFTSPEQLLRGRILLSTITCLLQGKFIACSTRSNLLIFERRIS